LVAALPATIAGATLDSHQGLSYGGLVLNKKAKLHDIVVVFQKMLQFLHENGIEKLHIKLLPKIYSRIPSDELDYLLFIANAELARTDILSVIDNQNPIKIAP